MLIRLLILGLLLLLPVSSGAATLVDQFTQASTVNLEAHTATPDAGTWTKQVGASSMLAQSNDILAPPASDSVLIVYTIDWTPAAASYDVSLKWVQESTAATPADDVFAMIARYTDTSNYYYAAFKRDDESPDTYIGKFVAGVRTDLVSGDCGQVNGDTLKFSITDGVKKIQVNGVDCSGLTTSDNALTSTGLVGVACGKVTAAGTNDDCSGNTMALDDFTLVDTSASASARNLMLMGVGQ
jgi:hypothetical protein